MLVIDKIRLLADLAILHYATSVASNCKPWQTWLVRGHRLHGARPSNSRSTPWETGTSVLLYQHPSISRGYVPRTLRVALSTLLNALPRPNSTRRDSNQNGMTTAQLPPYRRYRAYHRIIPVELVAAFRRCGDHSRLSFDRKKKERKEKKEEIAQHHRPPALKPFTPLDARRCVIVLRHSGVFHPSNEASSSLHPNDSSCRRFPAELDY